MVDCSGTLCVSFIPRTPCVRSCVARTLTLTQEDAPALPAATFAKLRASVLAHPLRWRANGLDADNFGKTSGWVIYFNSQGVDAVCSSPLFRAVCPFFRHVRLPAANAWVRGCGWAASGTGTATGTWLGLSRMQLLAGWNWLQSPLASSPSGRKDAARCFPPSVPCVSCPPWKHYHGVSTEGEKHMPTRNTYRHDVGSHGRLPQHQATPTAACAPAQASENPLAPQPRR